MQPPLILVLEDDKTQLMIIEEILKREFLHAEIIAKDAWLDIDRALRESTGRSRVLISDINMPGINGGDFCAIVAKRFPDVRIIIMSAEDLQIIRARFKLLLKVPVVRKASGAEAIIEEVRKALATLPHTSSSIRVV